MIKKYRPKIFIEAVKFTGNVSEIKAFVNRKISEYKDEIRIPADPSGIGTFNVRIGDYVIKENNGTIYMCTGDWFEKYYEEIKSSEDTENKQDEQVIKEDTDNDNYVEDSENNEKLYSSNETQNDTPIVEVPKTKFENLEDEEAEEYQDEEEYQEEDKEYHKDNEYIDFMVTSYALCDILVALHNSNVKEFAVTKEDNDLHIRIDAEYLKSIVYKIKKFENLCNECCNNKEVK